MAGFALKIPALSLHEQWRAVSRWWDCRACTAAAGVEGCQRPGPAGISPVCTDLRQKRTWEGIEGRFRVTGSVGMTPEVSG